ncbi:MAG: ATP-binding protein [Deltaproteobacteria bacterium]|nr:ATP-binding protein [Deltaproteobacteria bacterium]
MAQRIAISGSAGVGKSTLAQAAAAELGWPCLPEGMREYLESTEVDIHHLGIDGLRALVLRLWDERQELEAKYPAFVADRSSFDTAAFWMFYGYAKDEPDTLRLFDETLRRDRYDRVFLLPWGRIPLVADGVRHPNRHIQLHVQSMIVGLVHEFGPAPTWVEPTSLAERVRFVVERASG